MGEWDFLKEAAKQVPALCVLAFVVSVFLKHLAEARKSENENRNVDREIIAKIVLDATVERKEAADRVQKISDSAHEAATDTKDRFIEAIGEMRQTMHELRTAVVSRMKD
ncbi:MAG: hypothetical protein IT428_06040 [Planctomycetaceae bacterium]|nr:hypothetical protein [Planctomycetaceae bacterium]